MRHVAAVLSLRACAKLTSRSSCLWRALGSQRSNTSLTMHARMRMAAVAAVMAMALVAAAVAPAAAHLHTNPLSKINVAGVKMQLGTGVRWRHAQNATCQTGRGR
jgi:hypothetical protein